jgi:hypothetical protein
MMLKNNLFKMSLALTLTCIFFIGGFAFSADNPRRPKKQLTQAKKQELMDAGAGKRAERAEQREAREKDDKARGSLGIDALMGEQETTQCHKCAGQRDKDAVGGSRIETVDSKSQ